jgi:hypothetical protein
MLLTSNDKSDLIVEVARQASQSKDKSLFIHLLLLEEQLRGGEVGNSEMSIVLEPQPSVVTTHSRYIE